MQTIGFIGASEVMGHTMAKSLLPKGRAPAQTLNRYRSVSR